MTVHHESREGSVPSRSECRIGDECFGRSMEGPGGDVRRLDRRTERVEARKGVHERDEYYGKGQRKGEVEVK